MASRDGTRATSRISNGPLSVALARSKTFKQREFVRANLLVDPWDQAPRVRAVRVVSISKLRIQQLLFCVDAH